MVLCILVFISDQTVYSPSLFVLCMISSCGFVAGQCFNKGMALGRAARLSSFVLLPVEEIGHWLAPFVLWIYFSAWLNLCGPFQQSDSLC